LFDLKVFIYRKQRYAAISFTISLLFIAIIVTYSLLRAQVAGVDVIGQTLVDSEFPPPGLSPFYLKPATWLMILITIAWFSFIELIKDRVRRERGVVRSVISVSFLLAIILFLYEVAYNFMIWGVMLINSDGSSFHPDEIMNEFPSERYKVNLVFATKSFVTLLGCSLYGLYVLREGRGSGE